MSFKVGDEVLCSREGNVLFQNMLGIIVDINEHSNPITPSIEVNLNINPFNKKNNSGTSWYFTHEEIRKLTKLEKAMR